MGISCFITGHKFETNILDSRTEIKTIVSTCSKCGKQITKKVCNHSWDVISQDTRRGLSGVTQYVVTSRCNKCGEISYSTN